MSPQGYEALTVAPHYRLLSKAALAEATRIAKRTITVSIAWGDYEFDGPSRLDSWTAPHQAGVYAIMYKKDPVNKPKTYTIVYFGESENLSERGFPWDHHRAQCWIDKASSKSNVYVGVHYMPGSTQAERSAVEQALIAKYSPACNKQWALQIKRAASTEGGAAPRSELLGGDGGQSRSSSSVEVAGRRGSNNG